MNSLARRYVFSLLLMLCLLPTPGFCLALPQGSEVEPPFTFAMPPGRVIGTVDVDFGQVEVRSTQQETRYALVNLSSEPVEVFISTSAEGISVSPQHVTLPAGPGNQVALAVTWSPQVAMALNDPLIFESFVNEVSTGSRQWNLQGFAGLYHLSRNGVRIDSLDFGAVSLGQSVVADLMLINHTDQVLPISVPPTDAQLHINLARTNLPANGSLDLTAVFTPSSNSSLQEMVHFQTTGFDLAIPMMGSGVTAPWLTVTDLQGQALSAHDFGEFTANAETVSFEVLVTNVGNAPTSSNAALVGFDYQTSSIFCSQEGLNLCAVNAATGLGPHIRNMAPGESRTLRFLAKPEIVGAFEKTIHFETANQSVPFLIEGHAVPFLLPRWSQGVGETGSAPSDGDYLTNPMGAKLANGLGQAQVFQAADIDSINLFNGNLMLHIPIGPSYPAGANLSYGLQLAYNANAWDVRYKEEYQGTSNEVTSAVVSPDPKSNAGLGFTLHMGRLFAPSNLDYYRSLSQTEQEKYPLNNEWTYIAPDNSSHTFHEHLHSPSSQGADPAVLYTRDNSYLRLVDKGSVNGFFTKEVHFPNGNVHVFQYRTHWNDTWIDVWRLVEIRDPYANFVRVAYQPMAWTLTDTYGRQQRIDFEADPYWSMRVREVSLTAFNQTTARYRFNYETISLRRPFDTFLGHDTHVTVSRLTKITLPDSTTYDFGYGQELGTRIAEVVLPTDAKLNWEYERFFFPYPEMCDIEENVPFPWQFRVSERTVYDQYGGEMDRKQFLMATTQGASIPDTYCHQYFPTPSYNVPAAEMVLYTFSPAGSEQGRLDLNYFSIWPFGEDLHTGAPVNGGWTTAEYGQNFTRNGPDPQDPSRFLSHQVYQMPHGEMPTSGNLQTWLNSGLLLRSTYIAKDLGLTYNSFAGAGSSANGRVVNTSTVYHDDGGKRTYAEFDDFDGLGHFRRKRTFGNIGNDGFTYITDYHPWRGKLILDDNGLPSAASTLVLPTKNEPWLLNTFVKKTIRDDQGQTHGTGFLFDLNKGHLLKERIWKTGTHDGVNDVVRVHSYNSRGELTATRLYGGDTQSLPTGDRLNHNFHTESSPQGHQYKTINTYQYGVLKTAHMEGFSHYSTNHPQIDFNTGLVKVSTDASGVLATTHHYDTMGRLVRVTSKEDANRVFNFKLPGVNGWDKPPKLIALDYRNGTLSGSQNLLKKQVIYFDNLGRVIREDASHPDGYMMRYDLAYNQRGWIVKETVTQAHNQFDGRKATRFEYDALGQVVGVTRPDGSRVSQSYKGVRQIDITTRVGSQLNGTGGVTQSQSQTRLRRNRQGQIVSVETPAHTTTFQYNALGALIQASRGNQVRRYTVDGRGFTTAEQLPEKGRHGNGLVTYADLDALGNVGLKIDGPYQTAFTFDRAGRLVGTYDAISGAPILEKTYSTVAGISNGRVVSATRHNRVTPANTGGAVGQADSRVVTEHYVVGRDGRLARRDTSVSTGSGVEVASFTQSWTYDDLGLIAGLAYPECTTSGCWSPSTDVAFTYDQGFLTEVRQGSWTGATYAYREDGQVDQIMHANGLVDQYERASHGMSRPEMIRLASGHLNLGPYRFDDAGNITKIGGDVYLYDLNSRLVRGDIPGGIQGDHRIYSYDAFDNLVRKGPDVLAPNPNTNRLPDATYDAAGQTTRIGAFAMYYDAFGLMESMVHNPEQSQAPCNLSDPDGNCWIYWYGPDNRRIGGLELLADGSGDYFWTIRDQDGKVLRTFKSLTQTLEATEDHFYGTTGAFATKDLLNGDEKHLHNDHLGTARGASDAFGNFLGTRHRTPFGSPTGADGVAESIQDWTGHERDPNDRTYYMKARTYFDGWGRFFTADPARAGWNLYTYGANNPINMVDPTGLAEVRGNSGRASNGRECHDFPHRCQEEVVPTIPDPEGGSTLAVIPIFKSGSHEGGYGFFAEVNEENQIVNVGIVVQGTASAKKKVLSKAQLKHYGLENLPGATIKFKDEKSIKITGSKFGLYVGKTNKIHDTMETKVVAFSETPLGTAIVDKNGARFDTQLNLKVPATGIKGTVRMKFGVREAFNYTANRINAGYHWAKTCGGLCSFRE